MNLADHLWQSTAFAVVAGLLTLAFSTNRARVRHWLWFAASIKFLIPMSLFIGLGRQIEIKSVPVQPSVTVAVQQIVEPFTVQAVSVAPPPASRLPGVLLVVWIAGVLTISASWFVRWLRIRALVRSSSPWQSGIMVSDTNLEPGVLGVFRPVLLLPRGIFDRLTPAQLRAIIAHEMCHIRHRDNLLATIHMFVETIFWFHPLVWWIGKRMVEERELACDEEVLRTLGEPQAYAEGILNVCKLYIESPLPCVSGVTGADLKKRIEAIMKNRAVFPLSLGRKALLGATGVAAMLLPLFFGVAYGPAIRAQTAAGARMAFTVASVKLHASSGGLEPIGAAPRRLGDRVLWNHVPLQLIVLYAYQIPANRLSTPVPFADSYDIEALADGSPTDAVLRSMFRALLEDRFGIQVHWETRAMELFRLLVAKDGSKLKRSEEDSKLVIGGNPLAAGRAGVFAANGGHLAGKGASMEQLADALGVILRQPIIDQTGLTGTFDFDVKFRRESDLEGVSGDPFIRTAIQETLGLRVESGKGPVEMLVIDHLGTLSEN